jgi:16S rRNA (cytidine1402-2'-O)-methyltransferase
VSGLPSHDFVFKGFLPPKGAKRRAAIRSLEQSHSTTVFYEAPHRILAAVTETRDLLGGLRQIAVARELTKLHEEVLRGPAATVVEQLCARPSQKGEFVLMIGPSVGDQGSPGNVGSQGAK